MNQFPVGTVQAMTVLRKIETGYVLEKHNEQALLHHNDTEYELAPGEEVDVFLYLDKKGRTIASTNIPHVQQNTYGWTEVVGTVAKLGVFVDIGIGKDILVSSDHLPLYETVWPAKGDRLFVTLEKDNKDRLLAVPASENILLKEMEWAPEELFNQPIKGTVYKTDAEGSAFMTAEDYRGFIHHTERKQEPRLGEFVSGRVIEVKDDGTLNVSLRPYKKQSRLEDSAMIHAYLEEKGGHMPFTDKSKPEDIRETFGISKAAFKRALGKLMKEEIIEQREGNTHLKK